MSYHHPALFVFNFAVSIVLVVEILTYDFDEHLYVYFYIIYYAISESHYLNWEILINNIWLYFTSQLYSHKTIWILCIIRSIKFGMSKDYIVGKHLLQSECWNIEDIYNA